MIDFPESGWVRIRLDSRATLDQYVEFPIILDITHAGVPLNFDLVSIVKRVEIQHGINLSVPKGSPFRQGRTDGVRYSRFADSMLVPLFPASDEQCQFHNREVDGTVYYDGQHQIVAISAAITREEEQALRNMIARIEAED